MPLIDNYLLDNYLIDGPSGDTTTRETIAANRSVGTMLANMTGVTLSNQFLYQA